MAILVLGVLLGTVVWVGAVVLRKRGCVLLLLPFPLLIIAWFVLASIAPNPEREFDRLFGPSVRSAVSDIRTIKPTFMDGHLISFRVSEDAYSRIKAENRRPQPRWRTETGHASHPLPLLRRPPRNRTRHTRPSVLQDRRPEKRAR